MSRAGAAFLRDPSKRLVSHDTPTHSSWRKQGERWLRALIRTLLRRGPRTSTADLEA